MHAPWEFPLKINQEAYGLIHTIYIINIYIVHLYMIQTMKDWWRLRCNDFRVYSCILTWGNRFCPALLPILPPTPLGALSWGAGGDCYAPRSCWRTSITRPPIWCSQVPPHTDWIIQVITKFPIFTLYKLRFIVGKSHILLLSWCCNEKWLMRLKFLKQ